MRSPWKWAEYYIRLRLYTFRYLLEFSLSCTLLYSKLPGPFQINPRSVLWNWNPPPNPTYPVSTPSSRLSDTTHSPVVFPIFFCVSQILDVIFYEIVAGEGERASEAAFKFEQTQWWPKNHEQVDFYFFGLLQTFGYEICFFGFEICILGICGVLWSITTPSVVERMPATGHHSSSLKDPEMKPILSNGGEKYLSFIRDSIAPLRKIWVASFKDNSWRQDSSGEVCLQSLSQAVGRSLQPPLYLQGPPQLLSLVQGLQESSNKVPRGPRCPPWNLRLRCQAFQPSWGLLLMEGFFYPQWRQLREKK